ncbi:MAG: hypothetical protein FWE20_10955, partial [Defluviitaleaceae bacterium]|nr:hypothetical protein [Defluviitaleaceae bacterium]
LREKYFHNLFFNSMSAVEDRLEVGLRDLENNGELLQSITGLTGLLVVFRLRIGIKLTSGK